MKGKRRNDYEVSFKKSIDHLRKEKLPAHEAIPEVSEMIERYFEDTSDLPSSDNLERMADIILSEDIDAKIKNGDVGILSEHQLSRIHKGKYREVAFDSDEIDEHYFSRKNPEVYEWYPADWEIEREIEALEETPILTSYTEPKPIKRRPVTITLRQKWSREVRERDGYQCQCCRNRTGIMHAHHILNYADYPSERYEVSNGITLCEHCHNKFHSMYGKHLNSREQLEEFLTDRLSNPANCLP